MNQYHKKLYKTFPSQPFDIAVRGALIGSSYHFERLKEYMNRPGMQEAWDLVGEIDPQRRKLLQDDINMFNWHLRSFFWELIATFDTLLQWANKKFELGVNEKDVCWKNIKQNSNDNQTDDWKRIYQLLKNAWDSDWLFEVNGYRNFAHRNFLNNVSAHAEKKMIHFSLLPVREGQNEFRPINEQLNNYGLKMTELVNLILPTEVS